MKLAVITLLAAATFATMPAAAEKVGEVGVDWLGSDIIVEAIADPKVQGVTCHVAYFERGLVDRLKTAIGLKTRRIRPSPVARLAQSLTVILIAVRTVRTFSASANR